MKKYQHTSFVLGEVITPEQMNFFKRNGFLHFRNFLNKSTVTEFIDEVEKVQTYLLNNNINKINGISLKYGEDVNGRPLIQRLAFTSHYSKTLQLFLRDPRLKLVLQLLENSDARIGENEKDGLVVNHYVNVKGSKFSQLGWHTDSPRDIFLGSRIMPMLNVGIHLDDCSVDNGGLRLLPGTHTQGLFRLLFRKKYFINNNPDKREAGFDIEAGDLTIHDGRLWHRVQQSPYIGEKSRRRVMYIPVITGTYRPKHTESKTPFYHKLAGIKLNPHEGIWSLAGVAKKISLKW